MRGICRTRLQKNRLSEEAERRCASGGTAGLVVPVESLLVVVEVYRLGDPYPTQGAENQRLLCGRHGPRAAPPLEIGASREAMDERARELLVLVGVHTFLHGSEPAGVAHKGFAAVVAASLVFAAL